MGLDQPMIKNLTLEISSKKKIIKPTESDVVEALQSLDKSNDSFLILSRNKQSYIQVIQKKDGNYYLEYQSGSIKNHYNSISKTIDFEKTKDVFLSYLYGRSFRNLIEWEKQKNNYPRRKLAEWLFYSGILLSICLYIAENDITEYYFRDFFENHTYFYLYLVPLWMAVPSCIYDLKEEDFDELRSMESKVRAIGLIIITLMLSLVAIFK